MSSIVSLDRTIAVGAPAGDLWAYVTDWTKHSEWIPLTHTETIGGDARGVGGRFRAWSGVGPVGFWDPMTVTHWQEEADGSGYCAVVHTGRLVKGDAEITVTADGDRASVLRWVEHFQVGRPGALGWRLGRRYVHRALDRALGSLAANVEAGAR